MTSPEFSFPVNELDAGGKHFRLPIRIAWLRGAFESTMVSAASQDGELDLRLSKSGTDVVVRGTVSAELVVPCSRCLEPAVQSVREELSTLAVPKGPAAARPSKDSSKDPKRHGSPRGGPDSNGQRGRETGHERGRGHDDDDAEATSEEADVLVYEGETLVLDDLVRDELLLGIPMIPLCSEACPGISPGRSTDEASEEGASIDPRLLPLLELKKKS